MANRNFHRVQSLAREVKSVYANVSIGASGAPTLNANSSVGVASVSRDSAGVYIFTLDDKYNALLHVDVIMLEATAEDITFQIESEDVSSAKTIQIQCKAAAVETDPSDGSVLLVKIDLKNTSVTR
jgi:hypothetical protein